MVSPFLGMDPYLEDREHWRGFHHHLAEELLRHLNPLIVPKYYAEVEVHTVLQELTIAESHNVYPDITIVETQPQASLERQAVVISEAPLERVIEVPEPTKQRAIHIYVTNVFDKIKDLVTAIELLSPANKTGDGLNQYRLKRDRILRSDVHLVEIDFLRGGQRPGPEVAEPAIDTDYLVLLNRAGTGRLRISNGCVLSAIWPIALNEALPIIPIPLRTPDPHVPLDLADALNQIYATNYYHYRFDYQQPLPPPQLRPDIATWLEQHLSTQQ